MFSPLSNKPSLGIVALLTGKLAAEEVNSHEVQA
jgi:hypothetical protein